MARSGCRSVPGMSSANSSSLSQWKPIASPSSEASPRTCTHHSHPIAGSAAGPAPRPPSTPASGGTGWELRRAATLAADVSRTDSRWYSWTAAANASSPDLGSWPSGSQNDLPVSFWICQYRARAEKAEKGGGAGATRAQLRRHLLEHKRRGQSVEPGWKGKSRGSATLKAVRQSSLKLLSPGHSATPTAKPSTDRVGFLIFALDGGVTGLVH